MSLLHGFDIHLKLFQLNVHLGMRKISLCEFSFLIPILQALCHLEVPAIVRIKKAYALWIKIMGKFNPTPQHQLPTIHFTWMEMFTGRENWRVRIIFPTTIAVNNPWVEPFHFASIQHFDSQKQQFHMVQHTRFFCLFYFAIMLFFYPVLFHLKLLGLGLNFSPNFIINKCQRISKWLYITYSGENEIESQLVKGILAELRM